MGSRSTNVTIGGKAFQCVPLSQDTGFTDKAAVYVILCVSEGGSWTVLDVGQTGKLASRIDEHRRKACWAKSCTNGNIWACVYHMPSSGYKKEDRTRLEHELRQRYNPPCGER